MKLRGLPRKLRPEVETALDARMREGSADHGDGLEIVVFATDFPA